jgi:hypothetical protein
MATWFGAETVVGAAGNAYRDGVSVASAEPFGYGLCLVLMGLIFAVPLWRRGLTTLADLFRERWSVGGGARGGRDPDPELDPVGGGAGARVRHRAGDRGAVARRADRDRDRVGVRGALHRVRRAAGRRDDGPRAGILLVVGLLVVGLAVLGAVGGVDGVPAALEAARQARAAAAAGGAAAPPSWLEIAEAWAVPVFGSVIATELVARVIATRTPTIARRATLAAGAMYVAVGLIPVGMGLVGAALVPSLADAEQLVPALAQRHLSTVGYALFAGGLISAILSTVDSTLLVASGLLSHNLLVPLFGVTDEAAKVRLARAGVLGFGVLRVRARGAGRGGVRAGRAGVGVRGARGRWCASRSRCSGARRGACARRTRRWRPGRCRIWWGRRRG